MSVLHCRFFLFFFVYNYTAILCVNLFMLLQNSFVTFCSCWIHAVTCSGVLLQYASVTLTFSFNGCTEHRFGLCSTQLYYCFMSKSFHAVTREVCHILFMLDPMCFFSISFLTAAVNTDSPFALCNYTTVSCLNLFILLQDSFVTFRL